MVHHFIKILSVGAVLGFSAIGYGEVSPSVDAKVGRRWSRVKPDNSDVYSVGTTEFVLGGGFRIGDLPLALNLDFSYLLNDRRDLSTEGKLYSLSFHSSNGYEIAGGVKAWVPTSYMLQTFNTTCVVPYVKIGHTIFSDYTSKATVDAGIGAAKIAVSDHTVKSTSGGFNYFAGAKFDVSRVVGITGEYMYSYRLQKDKIHGADNVGTFTSYVHVHGALVGVEVVM